MDNEREIAALKRKLKSQYAQYQASRPDYGCGHELTKHISGDYSKACRDLNSTLDQLAKIDPSTPTTRF